MNYGSKIWIFPDAECPPEGVNSIPGHESIIITNTCDCDAHITLTLFFTDKDPVQLSEVTVNARRVRCLGQIVNRTLGTILCLSANNMPLCWKVIVLSSHNTAELIREL